MRRVTYQAGRDSRRRTTPSASIARVPRPGSPKRRRRSPRSSRRCRGMPRGSTVFARDRPPLGKGPCGAFPPDGTGTPSRDRRRRRPRRPSEADRRHRWWPRPSASTLMTRRLRRATLTSGAYSAASREAAGAPDRTLAAPTGPRRPGHRGRHLPLMLLLFPEELHK